MAPRIISVDGNIGSGKSTLVKYLQSCEHLGVKIFTVLKEPVDEWESIKNENGETVIECFYKDQTKYAFSFQMMAYISRLASLRKIVADPVNQNAIIITERSMLTDKYVFAKMLYDDNKIEKINYSIYLKWFNEFITDLPVDKIIYLNTSPEICHSRILKRSRAGDDKVSLEYLKNCDNYHNDWLLNSSIQVLTIDGNINIEEFPNTLNDWTETIKRYVL